MCVTAHVCISTAAAGRSDFTGSSCVSAESAPYAPQPEPLCQASSSSSTSSSSSSSALSVGQLVSSECAPYLYMLAGGYMVFRWVLTKIFSFFILFWSDFSWFCHLADQTVDLTNGSLCLERLWPREAPHINHSLQPVRATAALLKTVLLR